MYTRAIPLPKKSVLLLGPRGTGKSTWLKSEFSKTKYIDLLNSTDFIQYSKNPKLLYDELSHLPPKSWVIIDEVQKVPALLDEVHRLIENEKINFILSGSSARKLKRGSTNLLAGRAITENVFPLVAKEIDFKINVDKILNYGLLPMSFTEENPVPFLKSYAETYLKEEISAEALTRNLGGFARFLEIAARQNAQVTNHANISREAMVTRNTVQNYFEILVDTLIGFFLEPWKLRRSTKQVAHPKFYFFDPGVTRALSQRIAYPAQAEERGALLETWIAHELRAYLSYHHLYYPIYFWRSHDAIEVDLFFETTKGYVAIEIKSSAYWENKFQQGLKRLQTEIGKNKVRLIGVYNGEKHLHIDDVEVFPVQDFLKLLWSGEITQTP